MLFRNREVHTIYICHLDVPVYTFSIIHIYPQREMCSSSHQGYTSFIQNDSYLNHVGIKKKSLITHTEITGTGIL